MKLFLFAALALCSCEARVEVEHDPEFKGVTEVRTPNSFHYLQIVEKDGRRFAVLTGNTGCAITELKP